MVHDMSYTTLAFSAIIALLSLYCISTRKNFLNTLVLTLSGIMVGASGTLVHSQTELFNRHTVDMAVPVKTMQELFESGSSNKRMLIIPDVPSLGQGAQSHQRLPSHMKALGCKATFSQQNGDRQSSQNQFTTSSSANLIGNRQHLEQIPLSCANNL